MKTSKFLFFILATLFCCDDTSEDCSTVLCEGPPNLVFEVLLNGDNVFDEGIFSVADVSLTGNSPNSTEIIVNETNFKNTRTQLLFLERMDWEVTRYDFNVNIGNDNVVNLIVTIELSSGGCCSGIPRIVNYQIFGILQENPNLVATINLN